MSLSKYYKSSDSFQPEKIIKKDDHEQQKWERTRVTEAKEDKTVQNAGSDGLIDDVLRQTSTDRPSVDTTAEADVAAESLAPVPSEPAGFDLSNYTETAVAEAQIAEAYQRGLQEGRENAEQDFGDTQRAMLNSCKQLDTIRETLINNSRSEVLEFAMAIAERIVRISVREQDRTIIATIDEALQQAVKSDEFTIYLHPKDYEAVSSKTEDLIAGLSGLNNIVVKQDNTIEQGGVKIESDNCTIDGTIATQFDVIREELNKKI